jgi:hypothetical protein
LPFSICVLPISNSVFLVSHFSNGAQHRCLLLKISRYPREINFRALIQKLGLRFALSFGRCRFINVVRSDRRIGSNRDRRWLDFDKAAGGEKDFIYAPFQNQFNRPRFDAAQQRRVARQYPELAHRPSRHDHLNQTRKNFLLCANNTAMYGGGHILSLLIRFPA